MDTTSELAQVKPCRIDDSDPSRKAAIGDSVLITYECKLDDGKPFDRSPMPINYFVGSGALIAGFDEAIIGLKAGEKRTTRVDGEKKFGERRPDYIFPMPRANAPPGLKVGGYLNLKNGAVVRVDRITDDHVYMDANHPLAGKSFNLEVSLLAFGTPMDTLPKPKAPAKPGAAGSEASSLSSSSSSSSSSTSSSMAELNVAMTPPTSTSAQKN